MTTQPEYVLVPRQPTGEMLDAAIDAHLGFDGEDTVDAVWSAMLAAAPQVHSPAPDSAVIDDGEQTRPSSPGAGASSDIRDLKALLARIKMDACPGWGDLSTQCFASAPALERAIAALQQPSAQEAVAFAVELADGSISPLGWQDMSKFDIVERITSLREGCRYVFACRKAPTLRPVSDEDAGDFLDDLWMAVGGELKWPTIEQAQAALESFLARLMGGGE